MPEHRAKPIDFGELRRVEPIARRFGYDRGQPIDRHYIDAFLESHVMDVRGHVLEIGDDTYTIRFGGSRVVNRDVLHVSPGHEGATLIADLAHAPDIPDDRFDCIIVTQTLQYVFDAQAAVRTLHRILKPGGVLLATMPGLSQIDDPAWNDCWYWNFTPRSLQRLFGGVFGEAAEVHTHGNVLTTVAFLHGLAADELTPDELAHTDPVFPFLLTVRAVKATSSSASCSADDADSAEFVGPVSRDVVGPRASTPAPVTVVITCFNQAHYLAEAIESVLNQAEAAAEILVIDDGSTDETATVAARYPDVRCHWQSNRGLAAARNEGLRQTRSDLVIFLDADDRLLPNAIQVGTGSLRERNDLAFVSGDHRYIDREGQVTAEWTRPAVTSDHYAELLRKNYIGMHAAVVYRREVLAGLSGFDTALGACEDYDVYLRIARVAPIYSHHAVVAEYRRYGQAMSDDPGRMLEAAMRVLTRQRRFVAGDAHLTAAWREGVTFWRQYYGPSLAAAVGRQLRQPGERGHAVKDALRLIRYAPSYLPSAL